LAGMPQTDLHNYIYHLSWFGIFLWFAFIEQLTPVPEEISLISLGYLSLNTPLNPLFSGAVAVMGLLTADNLLFYLSLKGSSLTKKFINKINAQLLNSVGRSLKRNAIKTLIIMALLPKVRFLSPIISATSGIRWKLFFFINSAATVFYVAVYMLIGVLFQNQLNVVFRKLKAWQHVIFFVAIAAIAVFLILRNRKFFRK
jgi:membrane protein DedA with SNARE-associated domain